MACEVKVLKEADVSSGSVDSSGDDLGSDADGSDSLEVEEVDVSGSSVDSSVDVLGGGGVVACEVEVLETTNGGLAIVA